MKAKVYIASPYTVGDKLENVKRSLLVADQLIDLDYAPYVPLLSHFQNEIHPRTYEEWTSLDLEWVLTCDVVLRLDGESKGADGEVIYAKAFDIPVVYSVAELRQCIFPEFSAKGAASAAIRTLRRLGYKYHGGELWEAK
jgi:hypothetical protein